MAVLANGKRALPGGGFGHFYAYAPEKIEYAIDRFAVGPRRTFTSGL
jgi:GSH-dependent disulfide-bond oxidoreductase